jgi:hypothetical protein
VPNLSLWIDESTALQELWQLQSGVWVDLGVHIKGDTGASGTGSGDVTGPASSVSGHIATFNGTTGKIIQDGGALALVATSGAYADLSGKPTLALVATSGLYSDLSGTPTLATVATTGAYSDLTGKPTLGTAAALNVGTGPNNVVQLDASSKLPAVDGSQLTGISAGGNLANLLYDVTAHSVKADGVRLTDGAITSGAFSFTSASAVFTAADVGKTIAVEGAGAAGATLTTTIATFVSATNVTLTASAGTTVTGAEVYYGTDNTTNINAAITAVNANGGGVVFFPKGLYLYGSSIDLSSCNNVTLMGPSRTRNRYYTTKTEAGLVYTGTGATNAIVFGSATGCSVQNFWLTYSSSEFTGNYVYIANTVALDACYNLIKGNYFFAVSRNSVSYWIRFYKAICNQVLDNTFVGGVRCISGTLAAGEYVNQITISDNLFAAYTSIVINGGFQECTVSNNTFEGRSDGQGLAYQNSSTLLSQGMIWTGNWFGDVTAGAGNPWIFYWGGGFVFSGNFMAANASSVGIMLNACTGFQITGNYFTSFANVITYNNATCKGGIVMGNFASAYTNFETLTANKDATASTQFNAL